MDSERKEIRHGWEGGREGSRSILRKEERNGREKSRYCQFRYHAFISTPPNVVSIEFPLSRAKMGEGENEFSSLSAEFPPPLPHPQRFANALCYGNTACKTRFPRGFIACRSCREELSKDPDPFDKRDFPPPRKTAITAEKRRVHDVREIWEKSEIKK